uniref:ATP synthase F0 subunit 8 n=1 Tax=Haplodiplatys aotouensis TaxID=2962943 RepID=UPI002115C458|nr:ATP synthase F0 subunit 8 [Haplodiplatys aotouensis]UTI38880.1 ATP synthase F0 subunit 8 [Haplodiplatys aotouensis]UTI38893.1 ATP synthase F0 subunit 8 [Haplodiplatys aotouensis]
MPQMAPLSWLMMYLFFLLVYVIFLSVTSFLNSGGALANKGFVNQQIFGSKLSLIWKW